MSVLKLARPVSFTALLFALIAITAVTARAEASATASGNIVDHIITSATINPVTGIATIGGTLQCSSPTHVQVYPSVRQLRGLSDHFAQYFGGGGAACDTTPTAYTVTAEPGYESDRLVPGPAAINVWAEYCADGTCYGYGTDREMRLMPAR